MGAFYSTTIIHFGRTHSIRAIIERLLYDRLHKEIYKDHVIHADETPVRVMRIDGDKIKGGKKTYMWVYRNSPLGSTQPVVLYDWQPSRRTDHPKEFLKDFSGIAVTDGYQVYHSLEKQRMDLKIAGCWIHYLRCNVIREVAESVA